MDQSEERDAPRRVTVAKQKIPGCAMVIFGASGDLTRRKLIPALYNLECDGRLDEGFTIVGFARSPKDSEQFLRETHEAIRDYSPTGADRSDVWQRFSSRLYYVSGQYEDPQSYTRLHKLLSTPQVGSAVGRYLYYLALPPAVAETVLECMKKARCVPSRTDDAAPRIMIEKPFGRDLKSAKRLNSMLSALFDESQIYRIDHYLAKDTIRGILVFRFMNAIFEPVWNRNYIDSVQITAAEKIGIEGRGSYYDTVGVVRDMVQNHLLQVLALTAMEPPVASDSESVRDKKAEIFKSLAPASPEDFVFGQYEGYRQERGVDPHSNTPTFVAGKLSVNNWRWQGVPFYIRSGKCLRAKLTEVVVRFKRVPQCVLGEDVCTQPFQPNTLIIRIQPDEGIQLLFTTLVPGREDKLGTANLDFRYRELGSAPSEAYERVLLDAMRGQATLFWRGDGVEAAWRAVEPLLDEPKDDLYGFPNHAPGSWGPKEADDLLRRDGRVWFKSGEWTK